MLPFGIKVYVSRVRVDMRKSYDGLSIEVESVLKQDPFSGHLFVFFNKGSDKVKGLYWDQNGFCIWQKRLEKGRFRLPSMETEVWILSFPEWQLLLSGVDVRGLKPASSLSRKRLS